jgi:hypothetical protein
MLACSMPQMRVAPTIKPCEGGFEMEVKAVDSFYKWRKKYREVGDAYMEAVQLGLATLEGDPAGRFSFVKRSLKHEASIETDLLDRCRFRRF